MVYVVVMVCCGEVSRSHVFPLLVCVHMSAVNAWNYLNEYLYRKVVKEGPKYVVLGGREV